MDIQVLSKDITKITVDALVVNLFEGIKKPSGATGAVDKALHGVISDLIESGEIEGKIKETTIIHTKEMIEPKRIIVVGLGKEEDFSLERIRQATASSIKAAKKVKVKKMASIVHGIGTGGFDSSSASRCVVEGALLADYLTHDYKTDRKDLQQPIEEFWLVEQSEDKIESITTGVEKGKVLAQAANIARKAVNAPSNAMTPSHLADLSSSLANESGFSCEILQQKELEELGMNAFLGVAKGSKEEPKLVIMKYEGNPESKEKTCLVGKGMTFDSGGISLKTAEGMETMKDDMGGAAAVIGAMSAIAKLKLKTNVLGIAALAENMPSGTAQKPGDIVHSFQGKTIEIMNTDAEGRLILADAVAYAQTLGITRIIDVATLTGSVVVALGHEASGYISNNDDFAEALDKASYDSGERCWRLPIYSEYKEYLKSDFADIKNIGGRPAGAITGGLFIGSFVENDLPWIHLDIAGTVWSTKELPYYAKGATGVGVRTLTHLAEYYSAQE